jgi:hypothetical protein
VICTSSSVNISREDYEVRFEASPGPSASLVTKRSKWRAKDPMSTDSARTGKAVEHLVAATCILASGGELNVSTALVDDEGVDAVFHRRNHSATLAVQIKSRTTSAATTRRGHFLTDIRGQTFRPRPDLYILCVVVDPGRGDFGPVWLVPSELLNQSVVPNARGLLRFSASLKPDAQDRWRPFRLSRAELPQRILDLLAELEA